MGTLTQVIGYQDVVARLCYTAWALQRRSEYREIGAKPPAGLLLHGEPGRGKTFMAECLIQDSRRPAFVLRTGDSGEQAADGVRALFQKAKEASRPSSSWTTSTSSRPGREAERPSRPCCRAWTR